MQFVTRRKIYCKQLNSNKSKKRTNEIKRYWNHIKKTMTAQTTKKCQSTGLFALGKKIHHALIEDKQLFEVGLNMRNLIIHDNRDIKEKMKSSVTLPWFLSSFELFFYGCCSSSDRFGSIQMVSGLIRMCGWVVPMW